MSAIELLLKEGENDERNEERERGDMVYKGMIGKLLGGSLIFKEITKHTYHITKLKQHLFCKKRLVNVI